MAQNLIDTLVLSSLDSGLASSPVIYLGHCLTQHQCVSHCPLVSSQLTVTSSSIGWSLLLNVAQPPFLPKPMECSNPADPYDCYRQGQ